MKPTHLLLIFSALSLALMIVIDYIIGPNAEFINAFSVVKRLFGYQPTVGDSMVTQQVGPAGELGAVLVANLAVGGVIAAIVTFYKKAQQNDMRSQALD
ncbi:MAG: hypothetical protein JSW10_11945 [Pseudomonadota bacterium]|nr:MAG: hypothetical protein JSW10_11945 [Pseudomonadota bacterium]